MPREVKLKVNWAGCLAGTNRVRVCRAMQGQSSMSEGCKYWSVDLARTGVTRSMLRDWAMLCRLDLRIFTVTRLPTCS